MYLNPECPWVVWHKYSLCSNGVEYFNENFQNLLKKYKNFLSVSITVDGTQEMHDKCRIFHNGTGSYDLAMKAALHNLKNNNIKSTKITLSNENLHNAFDAVKHMLENGFIEININCIFEDVWDNSIHPKILYYEIKKMADYVVQNDLIDKCFIRFLDPYAYNDYNKDAEDSFCGASRAMLSLDPKGDIFPCIRFMESSLGKDNEPLKIGDIKFGIGATELDLSNLKTISSVTN